MRFINFSQWESSRSIEENTDKNLGVEKKFNNSELIAKLSEVASQRKQAIRDNKDFDAQILEIESKLIKLDIERNDLLKKMEDLKSAKVISEKERKEGKTNVKE